MNLIRPSSAGFRSMSVFLTACAFALSAALALPHETFAQSKSFDEKAIRANMAKHYPKVTVLGVEAGPFDSLAQVNMAVDGRKGVIWADPQGKFLVQGELVDLRSSEPLLLTRGAIAKLTKGEITLPRNQAFQIKNGAGKRTIAVFSDPNCPHCKRYEKELAKVDDLTISVFIYPVLGVDSVKKARMLWCSKDQAQAWRDWMVNGKMPAEAPASCDSGAIDKNMAMGQQMGIGSTPTSYLLDGSVITGAIDAPDVEKALAIAKKALEARK